MPNRDKMGNSGSGFGRGGGGTNRQGRGPIGSNVCTCPKCGHKEPHNQRGIPCVEIKCPKCETLMQGEFC